MGTPPPIAMANIGMADTLILMVLALVVFGPRRLPEIGRRIGKIMYEVRKASNDFKFQMEEEFRNAEEAERRKKEAERLSALPSSEKPATAPPAPEADTAASANSPYPNGAAYSATTAAATAPESPAEPYPRVHPPSTGEQVPAAKPGRKSASAKPPATKKSARITKGKPAATKASARVKKAPKSPGRRS